MRLNFGALVRTDVDVTELIACDHCGIIALDTPRFGWKRWGEILELGERKNCQGEVVKVLTTTVMRHHCPAAVQYNEFLTSSTA